MKVAVCVPVHGDAKARFAECLFNLGLYTATRLKGEILTIFGRSSALPNNRNEIAAAALKAGSDWLFWLDADQTFPPDTLLRLLAHNVPIAGCDYPQRLPPHVPTATQDSMGLGVCLISAQVFNRIERPWFRFGHDREGRFVGEDRAFFADAGEAGFAVHVDRGLSLEIGHVAETELRLRRGDAFSVPPSAGNQ